jgi:hypothetical protein
MDWTNLIDVFQGCKQTYMIDQKTESSVEITNSQQGKVFLGGE